MNEHERIGAIRVTNDLGRIDLRGRIRLLFGARIRVVTEAEAYLERDENGDPILHLSDERCAFGVVSASGRL